MRFRIQISTLETNLFFLSSDPAYCEEESTIEYGLGENESMNITCNVKGNPEPISYRWVMVDGDVNNTTMKDHPQRSFETDENVLVFERINSTTYSKSRT